MNNNIRANTNSLNKVSYSSIINDKFTWRTSPSISFLKLHILVMTFTCFEEKSIVKMLERPINFKVSSADEKIQSRSKNEKQERAHRS